MIHMLRGILFSSVALFSFVHAFLSMMLLSGGLSSQKLSGSLNDIYTEKQGLPEDWLWCLLFDGWLVLFFILQHSLMATQLWKQFVDDIGCAVISRSIYVLATALSLQYVMKNWRSLPAPPLWMIDTQENSAMYMFFAVLHCVMWMIIYGASLTMDFPELVGIKQVYYDIRGWCDPIVYKSRNVAALFRHMRHPGASCFLVVLWAHPYMTPARFLLALTWTLYLLFGHRVTHEDSVYIDQQIVRKRMLAQRQDMYAD